MFVQKDDVVCGAYVLEYQFALLCFDLFLAQRGDFLQFRNLHQGEVYVVPEPVDVYLHSGLHPVLVGLSDCQQRDFHLFPIVEVKMSFMMRPLRVMPKIAVTWAVVPLI